MTDLASEQVCRHYSLADIHLATQNFDDAFVIGQGGFGKVYKGNIKNEKGSSTVVAIKRLDLMSNQGATEFKAEIEILSKLRHSNLVSLLGCCVDGKEMILVYEYMPRETVYHHLHKSNTPLSWLQRVRISIGAAWGLAYLHTGSGSKHGVIHSDVKSSNILLDEDLAAKISDFGLAKLCPINQSVTYINTGIKGTFGYMDPDIFMTGKFTRKTDVFAFGVVLFELLSGRHVVFPGEEMSLARWAQMCVRKKDLDHIVAAEIKGKLSPKSLKEFAQIAYRCLHSDPKERPTMSEVVVALQLSESLQDKFDTSAQAAGLFGFSWKMPSYFILPSKENYGHGEKKSPRNRNINNNCSLVPTKRVNDHNDVHPESSRNGKINIDCSLVPTEDGGNYHKVLPDKKKIPRQDFKKFSYTDLKRATGGKSMKLCDHVNIDSVYSGYVHEKTYAPSKKGVGLPILVTGHKLEIERSQLAERFRLLGEYSHPNLHRIIGYCLKDRKFYIVYESVRPTRLYFNLHRKGNEVTIPFNKRIKIVIEVARALVFLRHKQLSTLITERWMLSSFYIVYDKEFNAKFDFFDAGRWVNQQGQNRQGFKDDFNERKCDVYGLGMLLMEILTAKPTQTITDMYLAKTYLSTNVTEMSDRRINHLVDPKLKLNAREIERARELLYLILEFTKKQITMEQALEELEQLYSRMTMNDVQPGNDDPRFGGDYNEVLPQMFTLDLEIFFTTDLKCATSSFQNRIRWSGLGNGFKGWVHEKTHSPSEPGVGLPIFVKEYEHWTQHWQSTGTLRLLGEFNHPNLHKLLGYCWEYGKFYLVYKFIQKRSLQDCLNGGSATELSFIMRVKVVVEVARVLVFLQRKQLIIKDWVLDSEAIWLDKEFNTKFVDFDVGWWVNRNRMGKYPTIKGGSVGGVRRCTVFGLGMLLKETLKARRLELYSVNNVSEMSDMMIKNLVDPQLKLNALGIERTRELLFVALDFTTNKKTMEQALEELELFYSKTARLRQCQLQQGSS